MDSFTNSRSQPLSQVFSSLNNEKSEIFLVKGNIKDLWLLTVSDEALALLFIADTHDKIVFQYFTEQPDILIWNEKMPSPPQIIKSKYTN